MPLLITPTTPFANDALLAVGSVYAIIAKTEYTTHSKELAARVSYYASEAAYDAQAAALRIDALPTGVTQTVSVAAVRGAGDIMALLEGLLTQKLVELLPDATIEAVP